MISEMKERKGPSVDNLLGRRVTHSCCRDVYESDVATGDNDVCEVPCEDNKNGRDSCSSNSDIFEKFKLPTKKEIMRTKYLRKYWLQRYSLFSKYDEGIKMDAEGWFSVTPEEIAKHQARRCSLGLIVDAFTGMGGNAIQFALNKNRVIAIDIDPVKIELARHNARVYGVSHMIQFIVGDFFQLAHSLRGDLIFLSPPWGGPTYLLHNTYDIKNMLKPKDGFSLFKTAMEVAPNVVLFLPRNVDILQLKKLSYLYDPPLQCEVEQSYVNGKLKAITAYYGDNIKS